MKEEKILMDGEENASGLYLYSSKQDTLWRTVG